MRMLPDLVLGTFAGSFAGVLGGLVGGADLRLLGYLATCGSATGAALTLVSWMRRNPFLWLAAVSALLAAPWLYPIWYGGSLEPTFRAWVWSSPGGRYHPDLIGAGVEFVVLTVPLGLLCWAHTFLKRRL